jgi:uncharacterized membrane protein
MESKDEKNDNIMFLIAYLIPLITGIIVYILYGDKNKKLKFQSLQAILLGITLIIASIIFGIIDSVVLISGSTVGNVISGLFDLVLFLIWLYGMYTGYKASKGLDANIPYLSGYASNLSGK